MTHIFTFLLLILCVFCKFIVGTLSLLNFREKVTLSHLSFNHFVKLKDLLVLHVLLDFYIERT